MKRVVIIEDDPMVAHINAQYLESFSDIVVDKVFHNSHDSFEYILNNAVDLILLDIYMPGIDGMELLRNIRSRNIKVDVIMVTAANDVKKIDEALKLGIIDYLIKPFEYSRFCNAIEKFLRKNETLSGKTIVNQKLIDQIIGSSSHTKHEDSELKKGLQKKTLDMIRDYFKSTKEKFCTCETIASNVKLSKVTIRRYLYYMIEIGELDNNIDYETGGRPCMRYCLKKTENNINK